MAEPGDKPWRVADGVLHLRVRATPKASSDTIDRVQTTAIGPALGARVRAAPEDGRANAALEVLVARWLGLPRTKVSVSAGAKSRIKTLAVAGDPLFLEPLVALKLHNLGK